MNFSKSWIAWRAILHGRRMKISPYEAIKYVKEEIDAFERGVVISPILNEVIRDKLLSDGRYSELANGPR